MLHRARLWLARLLLPRGYVALPAEPGRVYRFAAFDAPASVGDMIGFDQKGRAYRYLLHYRREGQCDAP
jgi:hypothetical protein